MKRGITVENERRECQRFRVSAPISVSVGDRHCFGSTRDLSNQGVYFYLDSAEGMLNGKQFDFVIELPPEVTLSTQCFIRCLGEVVRTENVSADLAGIAARLLDFSITQDV